jgi:tetratricopeptide (TPR) repeat protein
VSRAPSNTITTGTPDSAAGWPVPAVAVVLILAALGAYWNSFNVPFLLDDGVSISDNSSIRDLGRIADVLSPPSTGTTAARPLLNLTFALNYAGGGRSVQGYHAVNLLMHICAGLALLGIVRRTLLLPGLRRRYGVAALPLAGFAALLWTLHPLQTEAVTYISQRAESLMGLFYLLTLYCFIRAVPPIAGSDLTKGNEGNEAPRSVHGSLFSSLPSVRTSGLAIVTPCVASTGWLGLSVLVCFCGMATKQVMVTAPVLVLLYDRTFVSGSFRVALANRRSYYLSLAASWLLLGFLMHRSPLAKINVGFQADVSWPTYALTELRVVTDYLKLAFWPHPLVFDYGSEILTADRWATAAYALIITVILAGVAIAWHRSPMAGFLGGWFFLILAPTSTVVPIAEQPMAESRMYLPLAAVVVLVTLWSYALGQRRVFVVFGIVAVGFGALTFDRNHDYRSELSIWEGTVARHPYASRGHSNLGMVLAELPGRLPEAVAHYEEALRLKPDYAEAHYNFAIALAKLPARSTDAIAEYETALRLKPDFVEAHHNLAKVLGELPGRSTDAMAHYETALRLKPGLVEAHNDLAIELVKMPGRLPEAIAHYEEALRLKPAYGEAHNNLAILLAQIPGRLPEAIAHYEDALRLKPAYAEAHNNLATALAQTPGRLPEAIAHFEEALRLKPDLVEAHNNLAAAYAATGRLEAAINQLEIAARLDPAATTIRVNLEKLKARRKP